MKQAVYNGILYVLEKTPYEITEDTDVDLIYVPADSLEGYKVLNTSLPISPYHYGVIRVTREDFLDAFDVIVTDESNAPLMTVLYTKGLATHEDYMTLAEAKAVTNEQLDGLLNGNNTVVTFHEFQYFTNVTKVCSTDDGEEGKTLAPFRQCTSLKEITLPKSVKEFGARAFDQTRNIEVMNGIENVTKYGNASVQGTFSANSTQVIDTIHADKLTGDFQFNNVFTGNYGVKNVVIAEGITNIGIGAFFKLENLESIVIPSTVSYIGSGADGTSGAFCGCVNLKRVNSNVDGIMNIPNGVTYIGNQAFYIGKNKYNTYITEINIPDSVSYIYMDQDLQITVIVKH